MKIINESSDRKVWVSRVASLIFLVLLLGGLTGCAALGNLAGGKVLTHELNEPLDGATSAKFDFYTGSGNLTMDSLTGGEPLLAGGTLQYLDNLGEPARTLVSFNGHSDFTMKWGEGSAPCMEAIEWNLHLNPTVLSDITAGSGGGNVKLNLANMTLTRLSAETGGGNMEVVLPDTITTLSVVAKSGAGNVVVSVPGGVAARITASTGIGQVIIPPQYSKIDGKTYQSPEYDTAASKVELTLSSGAGNVEIKTK